MDLIDLDRARQNIPSAINSDEPFIATLISAASKAVQKFCRRDFTGTSYDEIYSGRGEQRLILRQYPILSVESVRYNLVTVLEISNTSASNQQARVSITSTGLSLKRVASATTTIDTLTFAANTTLTALATAINALGGGWSATVSVAFASYPSADLKGLQGALNAMNVVAGLKLHADELSAYEIDAARGWLLRADNSGTWTDDDPCGLVWTLGEHNFRIQYTAGYSTIPDDIQEAVAELIATWFAQRGQDLNLTTENISGARSYAASQTAILPSRIRQILEPYRRRLISY